MTDTDIERLLKLILLGQAAFQEAMVIVNNHKIQAGKTNEQILIEAETKTKEALAIIEGL